MLCACENPAEQTESSAACSFDADFNSTAAVGSGYFLCVLGLYGKTLPGFFFFLTDAEFGCEE